MYPSRCFLRYALGDVDEHVASRHHDPHEMIFIHQITELADHLVDVAHVAHVVGAVGIDVHAWERWRKHAHAYGVVGNVAHGFHAVTQVHLIVRPGCQILAIGHLWRAVTAPRSVLTAM